MKRVAGSVLLLLLNITGLSAQESVIRNAGLPRAESYRLLDIVRDTSAVRYTAPTVIGAADTIAAHVVMTGGTLTIAGRIEGDVVVLNGDVVFEPGGSVAGDLTIIGGTLDDAAAGAIAGTMTIYSEGVRVALDTERAGDRSGSEGRERPRRRGRGDRDRDRDGWDMPGRIDLGGSEIEVGIAESYNRVEGLPLEIGPSIRTNGSNPLRVDARAIVRTERGSAPQLDRYGYELSLQQSIGGRDELRIGAMASSAVIPVEQWNLSDREASLATFLFHYDPRDHYERTGWGAFVRAQPESVPLALTIEYRDDEFRGVGAADPFTLFGEDWRHQPLVAEGDLRSIAGRLSIDTRDDREDPTSGFFVTANVLRGLSGDLVIPAFAPSEIWIGIPAERPIETKFTATMLDARMYARVGSDGGLALRFVGGGSLDGSELAPQFQHAFGGPGGVAAFGMHQADCGARNSIGFRTDTPGAPQFHTFYGCDSFGMLQAEYRGGLHFGFHDDWDDDDWDDDDSDWNYHTFDIDFDPNWVVFADAGRGWAYGANREGAQDTKTIADAGFGLMLGYVGVFWAVPLTGDRRGANFFVRLGQRF